MDPVWTMDCQHYELDPAAPLVSPLTRSGGWEAGDPNKAFYEAFFRDPVVRLPVGTWDITAYARFEDGPGCDGARHSLGATVRIEVVDGPAGTAAPTPSSNPTASSGPGLAPDAGSVAIDILTTDELLALVSGHQNGDPAVTVVAAATIETCSGRRCPACLRTDACPIGSVVGGLGRAAEVFAGPAVRDLYQRSGPSIEGPLGFRVGDAGLTFLGRYVPGPDGGTWPLTTDAAAAASDQVNAGELIAVEGWLVTLGWGVPCPAPRPDLRGDPADSPFVRCPAGWILADPTLPKDGPASIALEPAGFAIPVQYGAYERFAPEPVLKPEGFRVVPRLGTYLVRHVAPDFGRPTGWQVVGRLDPR
jgi:hypothetical protein